MLPCWSGSRSLMTMFLLAVLLRSYAHVRINPNPCSWYLDLIYSLLLLYACNAWFAVTDSVPNLIFPRHPMFRHFGNHRALAVLNGLGCRLRLRHCGRTLYLTVLHGFYHPAQVCASRCCCANFELHPQTYPFRSKDLPCYRVRIHIDIVFGWANND